MPRTYPESSGMIAQKLLEKIDYEAWKRVICGKSHVKITLAVSYLSCLSVWEIRFGPCLRALDRYTAYILPGDLRLKWESQASFRDLCGALFWCYHIPMFTRDAPRIILNMVACIRQAGMRFREFTVVIVTILLNMHKFVTSSLMSAP